MTLAEATAEIDRLATPMDAPPPKAIIERRLRLVQARWHTKLKFNLIPIEWRERWFVRMERAKEQHKKHEARERRDRARERMEGDVG